MDDPIVECVSTLMEIKQEFEAYIHSDVALSIAEMEDLKDDIESTLALPGIADVVRGLDALFFSDHIDLSNDEEDEEVEDTLDVGDLLSRLDT